MTLIFFEVCYWDDSYCKIPAKTVTSDKIGKIIRKVHFFLLKNLRDLDHNFRFDMIRISDTLD